MSRSARRDMSGIARSYAQYGAVVVAIDAPFARRAGPPVRFLAQDRAEQIQLIRELQRAVDVLRSRPNVDDDRIAYVAACAPRESVTCMCPVLGCGCWAMIAPRRRRPIPSSRSMDRTRP